MVNDKTSDYKLSVQQKTSQSSQQGKLVSPEPVIFAATVLFIPRLI